MDERIGGLKGRDGKKKKRRGEGENVSGRCSSGISCVEKQELKRKREVAGGKMQPRAAG